MKIANYLLAIVFFSCPMIFGAEWSTSLAAPAGFEAAIIVTNFGPDKAHVRVAVFDTVAGKKIENTQKGKILQRRNSTADLSEGDTMTVFFVARQAHRQAMVFVCPIGDTHCFTSPGIVDALVAVSGYFYDPVDMNPALPMIWEKR